MQALPEVVGWDLQDALKQLKTSGFKCMILETSPPRGNKENDRLVVVRQAYIEKDTIELTVCGFKQRLE
jgi:hypothetical protein